MSKLTLSYDEDESKMPSHVLAAHRRVTTDETKATANEDSTLAKVDAAKDQDTVIEPPTDGATRILLHSCCAPCSGAMVMEMQQLGLDVTIFFYNPNIHPRKEYDIRKEENKSFAAKLGIPFVDADYEDGKWFELAAGMEGDPERGKRCTMCFDMRMDVTADYAASHDFQVIATTNATSRWKDAKQVDASGYRAAAKHDTLQYWKADWQTDHMTLRKYQVAASERFYKQEYCGCSYSLRDSNLWRVANNIPKIRIGGETAGLGERWFTDPDVDAAEEAQDVVDDFFKGANVVAASASSSDERRALWKDYTERRKTSGAAGGEGLNNW